MLSCRADRAVAAVVAAGAEGAELVVLPELWAAGAYEANSWARRAEPVDGPTAQLLAGAAQQAGVVLHGGSIIERSGDGRLFNTSLVFDRDGQQLATYRKIHRFGAGGPERELLAAGEHPVVIDLPVAGAGTVRTGLSTCYDLRFPELYRALCAAEGGAPAVMLVVVAAWRWQSRHVWRLLAQARAVENQALVLACGASGSSGRQRLAADSLIIGADGTILAQGGQEPGVVYADVDLAEVEAVREALPVLADRRMS